MLFAVDSMLVLMVVNESKRFPLHEIPDSLRARQPLPDIVPGLFAFRSFSTG
jgi:hypothetical protein